MTSGGDGAGAGAADGRADGRANGRADLVIRDAREGDGRAVETIRVAGWRTGYEGIVDAGYLGALTVEDERVRSWEDLIAGRPMAGRVIRDAVVLVAERDGVPVGYAMLTPADDEGLDPARCAELRALYVLPAHWSLGIGGALLEDGFRRMARPVHVLWTLTEYPRTRRFYESRGFTPDGARMSLDLGRPTPVLRYRRESAAASG